MSKDHPSAVHLPGGHAHPAVVHLPAPTAAPFMMALGANLIGASLVTSSWLLCLGVPLFVAAAVSWFREVLPNE